MDNIRQKINSGTTLTEKEAKQYNTFRSEVSATMSEYYLGNEDFIHRLVMEDASLAERIVDSFKNMRKTFSRLSDSEARAAHKRLHRAEDLYLKAAKAAGNKHLQRLLLSDLEDDEDSNEHISEDMKVSDIEYSRKNAIENYEKRIDAWDGKTEGFSFVMGETPAYLSEITVSGKKIGNKQVRIDATKIKKIMNEHSEMTLEVIKSLPSLLNDPILVLDSRTVEGRLVLIGEVVANGKPVMMALEINPRTRSGNSNYVDVIKVASAYTRSNTQNMLNNSNIRYVDKK